MRKKSMVTAAVLLAASVIILGAAGCSEKTEKESTQSEIEEIDFELSTVASDENSSDEDSTEEDLSETSEEEISESSENNSGAKVKLLYEFTLNVFFSEEPAFTNTDSALGVDYGFEYAGGIYNTAQDECAIMYFDEGFNVLAAVIEEDGIYSFEVYNPDVSFNISADTGYANECLDLLHADIEMNGNKNSYSYENGCYRSYTGAWFFGIAKVQNGEIGQYDASWAQGEY